jgi:hypothetical protein
LVVIVGETDVGTGGNFDDKGSAGEIDGKGAVGSVGVEGEADLARTGGADAGLLVVGKADVAGVLEDAFGGDGGVPEAIGRTARWKSVSLMACLAVSPEG